MVEVKGKYCQNMVKVDPYGGWNGGVDDGVAGLEELDNMLGNIFDFPDFPMESIEDDELVGEWDASKSHYLGPIPTDVLVGAPTMPETKIDVRTPVFVPGPVAFIGTKPEPKHLSCRFEDPASLCIPQQNKSIEIQEKGTFLSQSPVSVLENSSSSSAGKSLPLKSHATRTRSKRARPSVVSPWIFISISPTSRKTCDAKKTKEERKKLPRVTSDNREMSNAALPRPTKKCTHCEITKTPQWREGPLGPKTLCNACGVRYRSGRLFPEYRPAASPTFVPSLHSNSHKKVIEMRNKGKHEVKKIDQASAIELVPASTYLLGHIR